MQSQGPAPTPKKKGRKSRAKRSYGAPKQKSMAMNNPYQNIQPKSNIPGFNFPGAVM